MSIQNSKYVQVIPWTGTTVGEWEKQRSELMCPDYLNQIRFGSSEIGSVTGVNKYCGKFSLFNQKVGREEGFTGSIRTLSGNHNEPFIADLFQYWDSSETQKEQEKNIAIRKQQNNKLREVGKAEYFVINKRYKNLISSLDYTLSKDFGCPITGEVLETDSIVEIKNIKFDVHTSYQKYGLNKAYVAQTQQQMMVSELKQAYLVTLVDNSFLVVYKIEADKTWFRLIYDNANDMEERILTFRRIEEQLSYFHFEDEYLKALEYMKQLEPEPDGSEYTTDSLKQAYPKVEDIYIGAEEDKTLAENYLSCNIAINELNEQKATAKNKLLQRMNGRTKMKVEDITVSNLSKFTVTKN